MSGRAVRGWVLVERAPSWVESRPAGWHVPEHACRPAPDVADLVRAARARVVWAGRIERPDEMFDRAEDYDGPARIGVTR